MKNSSRKRRRMGQRAHQAMEMKAARRAVARAEKAIQAAARPVTDISALRVSPEDVQRAGTASETLKWYVARCEPMGELKALSGLRERRLSAYLPMERGYSWRLHGKTLVERALFPGYVFVGLYRDDGDCGQSHYEITRVSGIEGMVKAGNGQPALIDPWIVLQIAALEAGGAFDHTAPAKPTWLKGQDVRIAVGTLAGWIAKVEGADKGQVRVCLTGLIKGSMSLKADHVEALAAT